MAFVDDKKVSESFSKGLSSVFDLYPSIELPERFEMDSFKNGLFLDANALERDWKKTGNDLEKAMKEYNDSSKKTSGPS